MYFPIIDWVEKNARNMCRWFFATCLFCTPELREETNRFFETGRTSFRFFEWLDVARLKTLFPGRWKAVVADFSGAYFKLSLLAVFVSMLAAVVIKKF